MKDNFDKACITVVIIFLFIIGVAFSINIGYRVGQLDALNGIQHFQLVTNVTSNVTWKEIK